MNNNVTYKPIYPGYLYPMPEFAVAPPMDSEQEQAPQYQYQPQQQQQYQYQQQPQQQQQYQYQPQQQQQYQYQQQDAPPAYDGALKEFAQSSLTVAENILNPPNDVSRGEKAMKVGGAVLDVFVQCARIYAAFNQPQAKFEIRTTPRTKEEIRADENKDKKKRKAAINTAGAVAAGAGVVGGAIALGSALNDKSKAQAALNDIELFEMKNQYPGQYKLCYLRKKLAQQQLDVSVANVFWGAVLLGSSGLATAAFLTGGGAVATTALTVSAVAAVCIAVRWIAYDDSSIKALAGMIKEEAHQCGAERPRPSYTRVRPEPVNIRVRIVEETSRSFFFFRPVTRRFYSVSVNA